MEVKQKVDFHNVLLEKVDLKISTKKVQVLHDKVVVVVEEEVEMEVSYVL